MEMLGEVLTGFYNKLSTYTATGECYNLVAPGSAIPPYITFGLLTETPMGDFADFEAIENLTFYVNCFSSKSIADSCSIADSVMTVMDSATITASGYSSMKCQREFISSPLYDLETGVYQISLRYRIWLDKSG